MQLPGDLPFRFDLQFDWRVFGYIAAVALASGIGVGLLPALRASRADLNSVLREGGRGTADGGGRQRARSVLVVAQVAVSLVLLVAAALFVRSVQSAESIDLGFDPSHVLNAGDGRGAAGLRRSARTRLLRRTAAAREADSRGREPPASPTRCRSATTTPRRSSRSRGSPRRRRRAARSRHTTPSSPEYIQTMKPRLVQGALHLTSRRPARRAESPSSTATWRTPSGPGRTPSASGSARRI